MLCAGIVASCVLNVHRRAGSRHYLAEDFVGEETINVTPKQAHNLFMAWATGLNAAA